MAKKDSKRAILPLPATVKLTLKQSVQIVLDLAAANLIGLTDKSEEMEPLARRQEKALAKTTKFVERALAERDARKAKG